MSEDTFEKEKAKFVQDLQKAGYDVVDDHGVVMALVSKEAYKETYGIVKKIADSSKYKLSFGVKMIQGKD